MTDIIDFPAKPERPELLIGPFETYKVVVEGRAIPKLTGWPRGDETTLVLDGRLAIDVPNDLAPQVAWLVANALAIGAGYSHLGAESKDQPFAPQIAPLGEIPR
jgi:hypothetical protein